MTVATGLNAARKKIVSPFEMPPWMPPERFVVVKTFPRRARNASLCSQPVSRMPPKPEPT